MNNLMSDKSSWKFINDPKYTRRKAYQKTKVEMVGENFEIR